MYFDNPGATAQQNKTATWDVNYSNVWHLTETSGQHLSSVSGGASSTTVTVTKQGAQVGQINRADDFSGSGTFIKVDNANIPSQTGTVSMWAYRRGDGDLISAGSSGNDFRFLQQAAGSNVFGFYISGEYRVGYTMASNTWVYITLAWDQTSGTTLYINGVQAGNNPSLPPAFNQTGFDIGRNRDTSLNINAIIDEVRVSSAARGADWTKTEYNNQSSPSTFFTLGSAVRSPTVLYWKFEEGNGTSANDSTGNGKTGVISASSMWDSLSVQNRWGNFALKFDGTSNKVTRSYSADTELDPGTGDLTVATWFRHPATASGTQTLIDRFSTTGYKAYMNSTGNICFDISDATHNDSACTDTTYNDNAWHHFEGVRDTTNGKINIFIDGKLRKQIALTATATISGATLTFSVGVAAAGNNYWNGFIDEVKVMTTARSAQQVKTDINVKSTVAGASATIGQNSAATSLNSGLVGYWKLDETSGQALDASGNGLNGTWNGAGTHYMPGKYGNGGLMSSGGDYIRTSGNTLLSTRSWTVSAWIYPTYLPNNGEWTSITFKAGTDPGVGTMSMQFQGPELDFNYYTDNPTPNCDGGWCRVRTTGGSFSTNKWYHLVFTHDDATGISKVYVNGTLKVQDTFRANDTQMNLGNNPFDIGNDGGYNEYFRGTIDEVRVYNRVFSTTEVSQLYNWAPGPIGYWKFDENKDNSCSGGVNDACDSSGNGQDGAQQGSGVSHWRPGKVGSAGYFDGATDRIEIANTNTLNMRTSAMTVSAWVYAESYPSSFPEIVKKDSEFILRHDGTNIQFFTWATAAANQVTYTLDIRNTWYYITGVYDAQDPVNTQKLYVNGVLVSQNNTQSGALANNTNTVGIGNQPGGGEAFKGRIDDVKIYNYARSNEQIVQDMNAGHPAPGSPVGSSYVWWKFNEGQGTLMHNSGTSGSSKDLTVSNPVWTNPGKNDRALSFNGSSTSGNAGNLSLNSDFTVETWMYINAYSASSPIQKSYDYAFELDGNNRLYFSTSCYWYNTYASPSTGAWHHIVMTVAGSKMTGYIDGRQEVSADTGCIQTSNTNNLYIGSYDGTQEYFNGRLDDLKLYNYALSAEQVKIAFNQASSLVLGKLSTESDGLTSSNSNSRMYCPPGNTETNCAAGQNPSPGGEWNYENISGTTIYDTSGNSNNGTYLPNATNLTKGTGPIGKALYYNGTDSVVNIPDNSTLKNSNALSFSTWIKFTSTANAQIATRIQSGLSSWKLNTNASSEISFTGDPDGNPVSGSSCTITSTNAQLQTNTWYHIGFSFSGGTVRLYKNGVVMSTTSTGSCSTLYDTGTSIQLGGSFDTNNFQGYLDLTRLYTYTRTQAQFAWDYNRGGPVGWWKMDECSGLTVNDSSGNGFSGTLNLGAGSQTVAGTCTDGSNSSAWNNGSSGKFNTSLNFDGNDDYVRITDNTAFHPSDKITLAGWVKLNSVTAWGKIICKPYADTSWPSPYVSWCLSASYGSTGQPYLDITTSGVNTKHIATTVLQPNIWYHIAGVWDGSNMKIYINGVAENGSTAKSGNLDYNGQNNDINIGSRGSYDNGEYLDGKIDDVRMYNYALTQQQILLLYNNGSAVRFSPLTGTP